MPSHAREAEEMTTAMVISGMIGWFVITSGEAAIHVVFWRCVFGSATLLGGLCIQRIAAPGCHDAT
jgi:hypothetical protein